MGSVRRRVTVGTSAYGPEPRTSTAGGGWGMGEAQSTPAVLRRSAGAGTSRELVCDVLDPGRDYRAPRRASHPREETGPLHRKRAARPRWTPGGGERRGAGAGTRVPEGGGCSGAFRKGRQRRSPAQREQRSSSQGRCSSQERSSRLGGQSRLMCRPITSGATTVAPP